MPNVTPRMINRHKELGGLIDLIARVKRIEIQVDGRYCTGIQVQTGGSAGIQIVAQCTDSTSVILVRGSWSGVDTYWGPWRTL